MSEQKSAAPSDGMIPAKSTRRRTINRPKGTFAHFLDALISYDFAYLHPASVGFTAYKEALAAVLQIQPRQLSRILSGQVLPEMRLLKRLSDRFPNQVQVEGWIPRLRWDGIAEELKLLPEHSVISVFVGHLSSEDVDSFHPTVLKDIGSMMIQRSFKFVYVFAPLAGRLRKDELLPVHFAQRFRLKIFSRWLDLNPEAERDVSIERRIAQRFLVFQTTGSEDSGHFWSRLPRYLIATNLLANPRSVFFSHQFSVAFDSGSVPYPSIRTDPTKRVPNPVSSGGWMYWNRAYDIEFREMFGKLAEAGLVVDSEKKKRNFPLPS